jgi:hypothetical protein
MKLIIRRQVFYSIILISVFLLVFAFGTAIYFYSQYTKLKQAPQQYSQAEAEKVVVAVGKLMVLPVDEQPTVATVSNPEQLRDQPFFLHAEQGDKVLIYATAGKAILYNPEKNLIVEVAPLDLSSQNKTPAAKAPVNVPVATSSSKTTKK